MERHVVSCLPATVRRIVRALWNGPGHALADGSHVAIDALHALIRMLTARRAVGAGVDLLVRLLCRASLVVAGLTYLLRRLAQLGVLLRAFGDGVPMEAVACQTTRAAFNRMCAAHMILPLRAALLTASILPECLESLAWPCRVAVAPEE